MKRMTKKLGAVVLALCMCFSLCCTALVSAAEGDTYSITISNAQIDHTYTAYKVFDATYDGNGNVAYSTTSSNPWYTEFTSNLTIDGYAMPFSFTETSTTDGVTTYTVQVAVKNSNTGELYSDTDIINYLNAIIAQYNTYDSDGNVTGVDLSKFVSTEGASEIAEAQTLVLYPGEPGYYFVTSSLGSVVSITTADPDAYIIDKNNPPGDLNKTLHDGLLGDDSTDNEDGSLHGGTDAIGDDVTFTVTANVPLYAPGDAVNPEGYLVTDYEFIDHMSDGLEIRGLVAGTDYTIETEVDELTGETVTHYYATDSLIDEWVILYGNNGEKLSILEYAENVVLELTFPSEYTEDGVTAIQFDGFTLSYYTIDMDKYNELVGDGKDYPEGFDNAYELAQALGTKYPANATIEIDYTAHMTDAAEYENTNDIDMDWHMTPYKNPTPDTPTYTGSDKDHNDIYTLELQILKVDGSDETIKLEGAQFQLTGTNINEVVTSSDYHYDPLENLAAYQAAKAAGTELWFQLIGTDADGNPIYTDVDPYELSPDDPTLEEYVRNTYADDPATYPDAEGYYYVAYTLDVEHSGGLQPADQTTKTVTGWTDENGMLVFNGLTVGDWTLTEITAPDGYNLLPEDFEMTISVSWGVNSDGELVPTFVLTANTSNNDYALDPDTGIISITVENNTGTELPSTGGIGTTIFYIIGGVLVVGAVVVLVTRRRMTSREN